ncbi:mycothiol synthase [Streptomyces avermitilis]|uniref:Mycothiol acetyltransferase n=2 Tax=Streptomyces avermitilis TaxID=33903 RepID=MSHD_STRAW|nr:MULTISPECIES: mycothiol synthase [Streptomyces]Q82G40.1 RecName: Full=Mycothiol acetyltransferase; Short=MSH acetyltransferase; AltName: Full=Mycothiol synthase [Streptomyces avermitilis MA-4680 = NBRC 14893]KUN50223.1 mycothiol synthase [Streptomyces avermitilis]MYS99648.1 mycothiol synthase [Streptomyces sp. SID5469]OOV32113.1 mycothiol synthase [Streptomyces avermitilis]BAC71770.1 putative N-cysteinyl-1-D-myo-inosityl-2-amino-2-deoxy-alpha-D-glucopyranoside acetyltransferase [Streptomyce
MTSDDTVWPGAGRSIETLAALSPGQAEAVLALLDEAARVDGQPAVSEQGRLQLRGGEREGVRHLLLSAGDTLVGYAQLEDTDPVEAPAAELVVHPAHRGRGHGRALGTALLAATGKRLRAWAHGGHSAARHLAQVLGLTLFRELRQMRRPLAGLDLAEPKLPDGVTVRAFVPGQDDAAWLAVNAAAFAHHPEQGSLTQRDLDDRKAEPWFDPAGFFLAERDGELIGFHWTKVHAQEGIGEVYVLGVRPGAQGGGLGKALTTIGLRHLEAQGLPTAMLYVDADNKAAVSVYERLGFATHETDLMYRTES